MGKDWYCSSEIGRGLGGPVGKVSIVGLQGLLTDWILFPLRMCMLRFPRISWWEGCTEGSYVYKKFFTHIIAPTGSYISASVLSYALYHYYNHPVSVCLVTHASNALDMSFLSGYRFRLGPLLTQTSRKSRLVDCFCFFNQACQFTWLIPVFVFL